MELTVHFNAEQDLDRFFEKDEEAARYRIIYAPCHEKQPNGAYIRRIDILAVVNKNTDKFNYQLDHPITQRIIKDYEELYSN